MPSTALITGASSGLGLEFATLHAEHGGDVVLVARREEELQALAKKLTEKHHSTAHVLPLDLAKPESIDAIKKFLDDRSLVIDVLINNAGFGGHGAFTERERSEDASMIAVNCAALTALTHLLLPGMIERKRGKILNVASTAGFIPGPLQAVYYATKAYVLSLSEALMEETKGTGVTVTALCPGPVKTGFINAADVANLTMFKLGADPRNVARKGYKGMLRGKRIVFDKFRYFVMFRFLLPFVPRRLVTLFSKWTMEY